MSADLSFLDDNNEIENSPIEWPEEEVNEEEEVFDMLMDICAEGALAFHEMRRELLNHPYILEHPEVFKTIKERVEYICEKIEDIWVE